MTSCVPFPGISTPGKNRGCAYTGPSTLKAPILPNCLALTFCGLRVLSFKVAPVRKLSYCEVVTWAREMPAVAMNTSRLKRIHRLIRTPPAREHGKIGPARNTSWCVHFRRAKSAAESRALSIRFVGWNFVGDWLVRQRSLGLVSLGLVVPHAVGTDLTAIRMVHRFHCDHLIASHLMIPVGNPHLQNIFRYLELSLLADRKQSGVLVIQRAHVVLHIVGAQQILRTELFIGVDVSRPNGGPDASQSG